MAARNSLPSRNYRHGMPLDFSGVGDAADSFKWQQVAAVIETAILDGTIPPRQAIPSETQIMQAAGVGRKTARRAVHDLRDRGIVYTVQSLGTFAAEIRPG